MTQSDTSQPLFLGREIDLIAGVATSRARFLAGTGTSRPKTACARGTRGGLNVLGSCLLA